MFFRHIPRHSCKLFVIWIRTRNNVDLLTIHHFPLHNRKVCLLGVYIFGNSFCHQDEVVRLSTPRDADFVKTFRSFITSLSSDHFSNPVLVRFGLFGPIPPTKNRILITLRRLLKICLLTVATKRKNSFPLVSKVNDSNP